MRPLFLCLLFALLSCGNDNPATGGGHVPNFVKGMVTDGDGNPIAGSKIYLRRVELNDSAEIITSEAQTVSTADGLYEFENVESGYSYVISENDSLVSVKQIDVPQEGELYVGATLSSKKRTIIGRIFGKSKINPFIPGLRKRCSIDSNSIYTLKDIPSTTKEVAFVSGKMVNFLPITINSNNETIYIKDFGFSYGGFSSIECENSYNSLPSYKTKQILYTPENTPQWYEDKDFDGVVYETTSDAIVFNFTGEYDSLWSNPLNWYSGMVPSINDSVSIVSGICYNDGNSNTNVVTLGKNTIFKPYRSGLTKVVGEGGVFSPKDSVTVDEIVVKDTLFYNVPSAFVSYPSGVFSGAGVLVKNGPGEMYVATESLDFTGVCHIKEGKIKARARTILGFSSLIIGRFGVFDLENKNALADFISVHIEYDSTACGRVELDNDSDVHNLYIGAEKLAIGNYTMDDYPRVIQNIEHYISVIE